MNTKKWLQIYAIMQIALLMIVAATVIYIDPFFHYHKPLTSKFFYPIYNERSQNDGITRNFDYDAMITGTSMTENFYTTEVDDIFGVNSIKVPYSGASYKEINDGIERAISYNPKLKLVIRCLDMAKFLEDKVYVRTDLGTYPTYLYDRKIYNDVYYIFNRDILFEKCWNIIKDGKNGNRGITSFDEYANWMLNMKFGEEAVLKGIVEFEKPEKESHLTEAEKEVLEGNIIQNVVTVAEKNPQIEFYYFLSPYSVAWWGETYQNGDIKKQIEMEKIVIEKCLNYENIHIFSYNNCTEITMCLDNYKDLTHYGEWINSKILQSMKNGLGELTKDNYMDYLEKEYLLYSNFDYNSLINEK